MTLIKDCQKRTKNKEKYFEPPRVINITFTQDKKMIFTALSDEIGKMEDL